MPPQIIIITGASKGMGAALALAYAKKDCVLGLIARNKAQLETVATQCINQGARVITAEIDVTDTKALEEWLQAFAAQHPPDLLITNAGVTSLTGEKGEAESIEMIHQVIDINLYGVIHSINAILPIMRERGKGQIALVSSLAAYRGMPITPAYCASKAAVKSYGEALRGWLAPEGIKVNIICPGFVQSDMTDAFKAPKPLMITADKAASIIKSGLSRNRAIIAFPFPLNLGMWITSVLPFPVASFFLGMSGYNRRQ